MSRRFVVRTGADCGSFASDNPGMIGNYRRAGFATPQAWALAKAAKLADHLEAELS